MPSGDAPPLAEPPRPGRVGAAELYLTHAPFVRRFLARLGVTSADLDDLTQEVFVIAHRQGGYEPGPARPTTWLAEIALRLAFAHRRVARRRAEGELPEDAASPAPDPLDVLAAHESLARVERALATLDLVHRAVFVLFEIEGESCESIATALGVPVGTVHSRLHYARRTFRKAYDRLSVTRRPAFGTGEGRGATP